MRREYLNRQMDIDRKRKREREREGGGGRYRQRRRRIPREHPNVNPHEELLQ